MPTGPHVFTLIVAVLYGGTACSLALLRPADFSAWSVFQCVECAAWQLTLALGTWCFCRVVFTEPGYVDDEDVQAFLKRYGCGKHPDGRQCDECEEDKPMRAYHNRQVDRCVLRLDHFW